MRFIRRRVAGKLDCVDGIHSCQQGLANAVHAIHDPSFCGQYDRVLKRGVVHSPGVFRNKAAGWFDAKEPGIHDLQCRQQLYLV